MKTSALLTIILGASSILAGPLPDVSSRSDDELIVRDLEEYRTELDARGLHTSCVGLSVPLLPYC